jgi:hypothetical protein
MLRRWPELITYYLGITWLGITWLGITRLATAWLAIVSVSFPFALAIRPAVAATLRVALEGTGDYESVQDALDAARDGDTVLVARGTYALMRKLDINLQASKGDPTPYKNLTIRSEDGPDETVLLLAGPGQGAVMAFRSGEDETTLLTGFTVAALPGVDIFRIDILEIINSSPRIENCRLTGATDDGVSIVGNCSPTFISTVVEENKDAGVDCGEGSSPDFIECTVSRNAGAGLFCRSAVVSARDSEFVRNGASGIYVRLDAVVSLQSCSLMENDAFRGGAVDCRGASAVLVDCHLSENTAREGGAVFAGDASQVRLDHCTLIENEGAVSGGAVFADARADVDIESSILWTNRGGSLSEHVDARVGIGFSCVEGNEVWPGEGNINRDPRFCGWGTRAPVFVDEEANGDGSLESPFSDIESVFATLTHPTFRGSPSRFPCDFSRRIDVDAQSDGHATDARCATGPPFRQAHLSTRTNRKVT